MSDLTFADFRDSLDRVLSYNWEDETEDFVEMLEEMDGCMTGGHVLYHMFVLHNITRVLSGSQPERLHEILPPERKITPLYRCGKCETICNRPDPLYDDTLVCFNEGDIVPSGICPKCDNFMVPV